MPEIHSDWTLDCSSIVFYIKLETWVIISVAGQKDRKHCTHWLKILIQKVTGFICHAFSQVPLFSSTVFHFVSLNVHQICFWKALGEELLEPSTCRWIKWSRTVYAEWRAHHNMSHLLIWLEILFLKMLLISLHHCSFNFCHSCHHLNI